MFYVLDGAKRSRLMFSFAILGMCSGTVVGCVDCKITPAIIWLRSKRAYAHEQHAVRALVRFSVSEVVVVVGWMEKCVSQHSE